MSKEKQIEEKICKNCIHYQMCVDTFRKGKQDGEYLLIDEDFYFAHADGCDFYADKRIYRKQSEGEWIRAGYSLIGQKAYKCSLCSFAVADIEEVEMRYCPGCGAKMKGGE